MNNYFITYFYFDYREFKHIDQFNLYFFHLHFNILANALLKYRDPYIKCHFCFFL